jgi:hypothetical protein
MKTILATRVATKVQMQLLSVPSKIYQRILIYLILKQILRLFKNTKSSEPLWHGL